MFLSISSLTTTRGLKRDGKKSRKQKQLSLKEFLKLNRREQDVYLDVYPKSSHKQHQKRDIILKNAKRIKEVEKKGDARRAADKRNELEKASSAFPRRLSAEEYESLNKKQKKLYDLAHKGKLSGKVHHSAKRPNAVQKQKRETDGTVIHDGKLSKAQEAELKRKETVEANKARSESSRPLRTAVNAEAIDAVADAKPQDFKKTAERLSKDNQVREDIHDKLKDDAVKYHEYDEKDLDEIDKLMETDEKKGRASWTEAEKERVDEILEARRSGKDIELSKADKKLLRRVKNTRKDQPERKKNFVQRDLDTIGKIMRGEKVHPNGRSNATTFLAITARYMLLAGGVAAIAMGGAPIALHVAKTLMDSWDTFGRLGASADADEEDERQLYDNVYDAIVEHLKYLDVEELQEDVAKIGKKFKTDGRSPSSKERGNEDDEEIVDGDDDSVESAAGRISYRFLPEERKLPVIYRSQWNVFKGDDCVACIFADPSDKNNVRAHNLRIWRAVVYEPNFSELDFPHLEEEETENVKEPYIITNDDSDVHYQLELHGPSVMTMNEARQWIRSIVNGD